MQIPNLADAKAFEKTVNNTLSNLGNANSDFNYGPWGLPVFWVQDKLL